MESWQDEIIKAQISQEIGVEKSLKNSDISIFLKSFQENLISCTDRDSFDKSWSSDLAKRFPEGGWRTINGASVFVNNGKVIAGLDGFNGEIDKFFEQKGKKTEIGDKKESGGKNATIKELSNQLNESHKTGKELSGDFYSKFTKLSKEDQSKVIESTDSHKVLKEKREALEKILRSGSDKQKTTDKEVKEKSEDKFLDIQDKIDYYKGLSPAEKEKYRSETVDFVMDLKDRLSKTKNDKVKEVYEKQIRFSDKLLVELQKIKRKPVSDMTDDEFLELKNPYGSKWKDLFDNYSDQVKDAVKNKKFPSVEDAVKEVKKMEKTEREFGSEEKARLLGMVADKFSKQREGDTDKGSEDKGDNIPKSKDGLYQIYLKPIKNKDGEVEYLYGVPSIKNKESKGAGDGLHDNLKDAIEEVEFNRNKESLLEKQKDDKLAEEKKSKEEEQKRKESNKGKTKLEIMNEARSKKVLNSKISVDGSIKTKKEHVQDIIRNGGKVGTAEVNKYKDVSNSRYNRMDIREQAELERKIKEGGKKTQYRLYTKDGYFYNISKTEYDYANQISNK